MKARRLYTSPVTRRATVELEGGFCGSVVPRGYVETTSHERYNIDAGGFNISERGEDGAAQKTWEENGWELTL